MRPRRWPAWGLVRAIIIVFVSGLAGTTLLRLAPGFGIDERVLDPRLSAQTLAALQRQREEERNPAAFYFRFLVRILHGDAGRSSISGEPVARLIRERAPTTIQAVWRGLALGWVAAVLLAIASVLSRRPFAFLTSLALSGTLISVPSAVLATVCLLLGLPPAAAIAAVIFPRVFPYLYEEIRACLAKPHVMMARARGLSASHVFFVQALPGALRPAIALAGVSVTLAFGASIPVEALADSAGLGQLAWQAALARDLPVLVIITLLMTAITAFANALADLALGRARGSAA